MTENQDKHAVSSGDSTEIASSHNNNAQGQSTTVGGDGNNIKPKDKKNDSETTVALADTQHECEKDKAPHDRCAHKDEFGTQRVYKKTSPNCVLTLYLPSREITLSGNNPAILRGIIYVDPKAIQGYRVYAQLTLTFRYGREDEEVMGFRFSNEAITSLHQVWPRNEEPAREPLSPLQEALVKRLGVGAHPFTLTLTPQAPPSVQLVPAKRYYGAPFGTSYDVRCFIGKWKILKTANNNDETRNMNNLTNPIDNNHSLTIRLPAIAGGIGAVSVGGISGAPHIVSPGGGGGCTVGGGSQGAVDKPFLLQDGRVGLRASLDKAWYTHGEDGAQSAVSIDFILNVAYMPGDVRSVFAIQHIDVCMLNNGKFKNIVTDSDTSSPVDHIVTSGSTLNNTITLKPQRSQTKNWIALEDTLQHNTEAVEITDIIAASASSSAALDHTESGADENRLPIPETAMPTIVPAATGKRKLVRSETLAKNLDDEIEDQVEAEVNKDTHCTEESLTNEGVDLEQMYMVQIYSHGAVSTEEEALVCQQEETEK
ncbi:LOW QUALITY PROTEIN: arrestin homolog [Zeugodacus cucurbitae]|uniref:LOW QUALITY PROTEIN: arrestin homolog n=1 Tax=Zeugodacus cucurbitae TaxID=28588 RepID=UPI0023D927D0|nr:LOW QUALITY PROTEIN: arrestin homolog [Zeugodacus cucurbitae]